MTTRCFDPVEMEVKRYIHHDFTGKQNLRRTYGDRIFHVGDRGIELRVM